MCILCGVLFLIFPNVKAKVEDFQQDLPQYSGFGTILQTTRLLYVIVDMINFLVRFLVAQIAFFATLR